MSGTGQQSKSSSIPWQAAEDAAAGAAGAARALPYAVALAAALSTESPFILVDSITARPQTDPTQVCGETAEWLSPAAAGGPSA